MIGDQKINCEKRIKEHTCIAEGCTWEVTRRPKCQYEPGKAQQPNKEEIKLNEPRQTEKKESVKTSVNTATKQVTLKTNVTQKKNFEKKDSAQEEETERQGSEKKKEAEIATEAKTTRSMTSAADDAQIKDLEKKVLALEKEKERYETDQKEKIIFYSVMEANVKKLEEKVESLESELEKEKKNLMLKNTENESLLKNKNITNNTIASLSERVKKLTRDHGDDDAKLKQSKEKRKNLKRENISLNNKDYFQIKEIEKQKKIIGGLNENLRISNMQIGVLERQKEGSGKKIKDLEKIMDMAFTKIADLNRGIKVYFDGKQ